MPKNSKKNHRSQGKKTLIPRPSPGFVSAFQPSMKCHMKVVISQNLLEAAAGTGNSQVWSINSLFDPDVSGAGHQPMYFDQLCTGVGPYLRYRVLACRYKVAVANLTANPCLFGLAFQPGPIDASPSLTTFLEKPRVKSVVLSGNAGGLSTRTFTGAVSIAEVFGVEERQIRDEIDYAGVYNAAPALEAYAYGRLYATPPAAAVANVSMVTELIYTVEFFGLVTSSPS